MMSATDYRTKATEWSARASLAMDGDFKRRLQKIARNWMALAEKADLEETLKRRRWR